jgi:hypothetical protein
MFSMVIEKLVIPGFVSTDSLPLVVTTNNTAPFFSTIFTRRNFGIVSNKLFPYILSYVYIILYGLWLGSIDQN